MPEVIFSIAEEPPANHLVATIIERGNQTSYQYTNAAGELITLASKDFELNEEGLILTSDGELYLDPETQQSIQLAEHAKEHHAVGTIRDYTRKHIPTPPTKPSDPAPTTGHQQPRITPREGTETYHERNERRIKELFEDIVHSGGLE